MGNLGKSHFHTTFSSNFEMLYHTMTCNHAHDELKSIHSRRFGRILHLFFLASCVLEMASASGKAIFSPLEEQILGENFGKNWAILDNQGRELTAVVEAY